MPIYSTVCPSCGNTKDVLIRNPCDGLPFCLAPDCKGQGYTAVERTISAPAQLHFKGAGWYKPGVS
jgi:predicted nucleic acid-binding Zn ribbon protein